MNMKNLITDLLAWLAFLLCVAAVLFFFRGVRINGKTYGISNGHEPVEIKWGEP
jgi:hypothetical protein